MKVPLDPPQSVPLPITVESTSTNVKGMLPKSFDNSTQAVLFSFYVTLNVKLSSSTKAVICKMIFHFLTLSQFENV